MNFLLAVQLVLAAMVAVQPSTALACTTIGMRDNNDNRIVCKNFDRDHGFGQLVVNKRGMSKASTTPPFSGVKPAEWVSKWGSIIFTRLSAEFPWGGINEKQLVVEISELKETKYPNAKSDKRRGISPGQWIQYQLDNFSTVKELVQHLGGADGKDRAGGKPDSHNLRVIDATNTKVHYMACDMKVCASIEFLGEDKPHVVMLEKNNPEVLSNSTYSASLKELEKYAGFGGKQVIPTINQDVDHAKIPQSRARFVVASQATKDAAQTQGLIKHGFASLDAVKRGKRTQWQIVYDLNEKSIHFRTQKKIGISTIKMQPMIDKEVFFCKENSAQANRPLLNIEDKAIDGDELKIEDFAPYTAEENLKLIKQFNDPKYSIFNRSRPEFLRKLIINAVKEVAAKSKCVKTIKEQGAY